MTMEYQYLTRINQPADLKTLSIPELKVLCQELRDYIITVVNETGGHLAPTLGAIELTVAIHYVYDLPKDKIIWDVGHQAYAHKILTGRREQFSTVRQFGGLSGFLKRSESIYDVFGAGHASTSISAALGIAVGRDQNGANFRVAAIIGDGAMTGGLAYEGINNAGSMRKQLLVVLNDNKMSISPNVGALRTYLNRIQTNPLYNRIRDEVWELTGSLPIGKYAIRMGLKKIEESLKNLLVPGILFDELGFRYFGPIDGHDLDELIATLQNIKDIKTPVMLHINTKKGKGLGAAESDPVKYHGVAANNGHAPEVSTVPSFQVVFGELVREIAHNRQDTVCITAAMREGTGLAPYAAEFPERYFDVGIAEGHAVTFAAGLATEKIRPIVAIYSTFLQRAYDHIIHDVAIQQLPVIFCLDRAGLAGEDGPTHHGSFDLAFLRTIPGMVIATPRDGNEFRHLLYTALNYSAGPFAIRYPKANALEYNRDGQVELLAVGSWSVEKSGRDVLVLATGPLVHTALAAATDLAKNQIDCEVVNCRFVKPLDRKYLEAAAKRFKKIVTIEEGTSNGGFGDGVTNWLTENNFAGKILRLGIPDQFITHGSRTELLKLIGLDRYGIVNSIKSIS
ncbi:MAG: 1-deoxy-D-xylulose-5-phosphate synthase [Candidatus Neomarinimicrobiota bacterium]